MVRRDPGARPATCSRSAFAAVSLAIVWGAMAERTRLWVYFAFGVVFTLIYSVVSHWVWSPDGWLFAKGMQDFAGSTVVHYQGALAGSRRGAAPRAADRQVRRREAAADPGPQHGVHDARRHHPVVRVVRVQPGLDALVDFGGVGFFAYVALNTNLAAAAGVIGAVVTSWIVIKKPDLSMMLNGAIAALVAITAACAFVAPWAAILIGFVAGVIVVLGSLLVEQVGIDDPVGALAAHGMAGVWGTLVARVPHRAEARREPRTGKGGLFYGGGLHQLGVQALGLAAVGAFTFTASFVVLWLMKVTVGIRTEPEVETIGARRLRARHVGLPGVLHPGARRLRHGAHGPRRRSRRLRRARPPSRLARPRPPRAAG